MDFGMMVAAAVTVALAGCARGEMEAIEAASDAKNCKIIFNRV